MRAWRVTNGTASDPRTRDNNGGKQIAGRLQWRPSAALAIGGSAATRRVRRRRGARERDDAWRNGPLDAARARPGRGVLARSLDAARRADLEPVAGADALADARRDERVRRRALQDFAWRVRREPHRSPRFQRACRHRSEARTWDAPVTRLETGAGYYIRRNLLAKGAYQHNWRDGGLSRAAACSRRSCISGCEA